MSGDENEEDDEGHYTYESVRAEEDRREEDEEERGAEGDEEANDEEEEERGDGEYVMSRRERGGDGWRDTASSTSDPRNMEDDADDLPPAHEEAELSARPKRRSSPLVFVDSDEDFTL
jgi:hypothetical protein